MAPAIRLARDGFVLTDGATPTSWPAAPRCCAATRPRRASFCVRTDRRCRPATGCVQPELAATLQAIAERGPDAFYKGAFPQAVEAASRAGGGIITAADFAAYRVTEAAPLSCTYRGYRHPVGAAAVVGWHGDLRDPEHPGRLRSARHGLSCR